MLSRLIGGNGPQSRSWVSTGRSSFGPLGGTLSSLWSLPHPCADHSLLDIKGRPLSMSGFPCLHSSTISRNLPSKLQAPWSPRAPRTISAQEVSDLCLLHPAALPPDSPPGARIQGNCKTLLSVAHLSGTTHLHCLMSNALKPLSQGC